MFVPKRGQLLPELTVEQQFVLLARALWREGYNDHLAGHITISLGDGTLLCNPWMLTWAEIRPVDLLRIDLDGTVLEGEWPVPLGMPLHLELHRARSDVGIAVHNHPVYGTTWANMREIPPIYDQSSAIGGGGDLVLVDEFEGAVDNHIAAAKAVKAMGDAELALLAGHGVFVLASTIRAVYHRAVALEQRCQHAWHIRTAGGRPVSPLPEWWLASMQAADIETLVGPWEAAARVELMHDPAILDDLTSRTGATSGR